MQVLSIELRYEQPPLGEHAFQSISRDPLGGINNTFVWSLSLGLDLYIRARFFNVYSTHSYSVMSVGFFF